MRVVLNGTTLYQLEPGKTLVIPLERNDARLVITDGFHISRPAKLHFTDADMAFFHVGCSLPDRVLVAGALVSVLFFALGGVTAQLVFKVFGALPPVYAILSFFLDRQGFIRLEPLQA